MERASAGASASPRETLRTISRMRPSSSRRWRPNRTPAHAALYYVIDEYQWLADPLRGNHYEGTILSLPPRDSTTAPQRQRRQSRNVVRDWLLRLQRGRGVTIGGAEANAPSRSMRSRSIRFRPPHPRSHHRLLDPSHRRRVARGPTAPFSSSLLIAARRKKSRVRSRLRIPCPQSAAPYQRAGEPPLVRDLSKPARPACRRSTTAASATMQRAGLVEPLAKGGQLRVWSSPRSASAPASIFLSAPFSSPARASPPAACRARFPPRSCFRCSAAPAVVGLTSRAMSSLRNAPPGSASPARAICAAARTLALAASACRNSLRGKSYRGSLRRLPAQTIHDANSSLSASRPHNKFTEPLPCGLKTDAGRARLVRRVERSRALLLPLRSIGQECSRARSEAHSHLALEPARPARQTTPPHPSRTRHDATSPAPEGLGIIAGLEDEKYPADRSARGSWPILPLATGFAATSRAGADVSAYACQKAFKRFQSDGFLSDGVPGQLRRGRRGNRARATAPRNTFRWRASRSTCIAAISTACIIEWKSLLRQVAGGADEPSWPRWTEFRQLCQAELLQYERSGLPDLPKPTAEQEKPVNHRLSMGRAISF